METTLYLTAEEKKLFQALPNDLKEGWEVQEEALECYESDRQIKMRFHMADFSMYPEMKELGEKIVKGEDPKNVSLDSLSPDVLKEFFFTIGARGVNAIIQTVFLNIKTDDDVQALAALSHARHELLEINATATYR